MGESDSGKLTNLRREVSPAQHPFIKILTYRKEITAMANYLDNYNRWLRSDK